MKHDKINSTSFQQRSYLHNVKLFFQNCQCCLLDIYSEQFNKEKSKKKAIRETPRKLNMLMLRTECRTSLRKVLLASPEKNTEERYSFPLYRSGLSFVGTSLYWKHLVLHYFCWRQYSFAFVKVKHQQPSYILWCYKPPGTTDQSRLQSNK